MSKTAVITGATSGIGAAYARRLAADGYDLIITGRRKEIIDKVAEEIIKEHDVNVNVIIAELSDDKDIRKVADAISSADDIEMLINNAGYFDTDTDCLEVELANHENMVKVHQIAPLRLIYAVLPAMTRRKKGAIINVSSLGAYAPGLRTYVYTATKVFLKQLSEGLFLELKDKGIKVQVLCPAFTQTDFYRVYPEEKRKVIFDAAKMFTVSPEMTVDYSLKSLNKNRSICLPGVKFRFFAYLFQVLPRNMLYKISAKMTETM
ncbi:MAG: SDR family NAD(P)-dependent oxidoreductase [Dehalococcoidia bacterium]|jgi:short-subunit dehydrogenase